MNYDELYEKGIEKMLDGEIEEAIKYFDEAIKEDENRKEAWMAKATLLMDLKDYEEAIKSIERALEINEGDDFAIAMKGIALNESGKNGMDFIEKALEMNPKNFIALYWKGVIAGRGGNKEEEASMKGKAAFLFFAAGEDAGAFNIFREVYYSGVDLPIRYECGVAYAAMLIHIFPMLEREDANEIEKEIDSIIEDCWNNREKMCKSAQSLLNYIVEEESEKFDVNDEKDFVFEMLLEPWQEVENGEEKEN